MSTIQPILGPPDGKRQSSIACIRDDWYVACRSRELTSQPRPVTVVGIPMVLFRTSAGVSALLDRCPHRNVPLSLGKVRANQLECCYHGWRFDSDGACTHIPGLPGEPDFRGRGVERYPAQDSGGSILVYPTSDTPPVRSPYQIPDIGKAITVQKEFEVEGSVHAVAENALDVPHTAFLHGGLFRPKGGKRNSIEVQVRRMSDRVEAEYIGEPRPSGPVGWLLAPKGGNVYHTDRFILPSIAQVEYRIGAGTHLLVTSFLTPVTDFTTKMFVTVTMKIPMVLRPAIPLLRPLLLSIFRQDASVLRSQTATIQQFGGEQFVSTEADVLGPEIHRLLRHAERGDRGETGTVGKTIRMLL